ncbi:MAG: hypothetical protein ACHQT8_07455 [Chlamydiales bacterium]
MNSSQTLRQSTPEREGVMRASKWLKHQVLLDEGEMRTLFETLEPFEIFLVSEPVTEEGACIDKEEFLRLYSHYVQALKAGTLPDESRLRRAFSSIFSVTREALYAMKVGNNKFLIKAVRPVLQLQLHHFFVSSIDGKFHPMVLGKESITWGIQFSYPQLYQDPVTQDFAKVREGEEFPNTALYQKLARWLRRNTTPTPFVFQGKRSNEPIRLGKQCFSWINQHAGLQEHGVTVMADL